MYRHVTSGRHPVGDLRGDIAILFGIAVVVFGGSELAVEYFACYLTDEALSVDNLFVFLVIISGFGVPRLAQQKVLLFIIAFALVTRVQFIFVGAALIENFNSTLLPVRPGLLVMAGEPRQHRARKPRRRDAQEVRHYPALTASYHGPHRTATETGCSTVSNNKRMMTPLLLVMIAVGSTDILFAFDSIPALFGLTQNVYLVFAATAFSLLGLHSC